MPETLGASETGANITLISGILAVVLAAIHVIAGKLRFLQGTPRSRWISLGSGVSVACVFIHILPELNEQQESIGKHYFRMGIGTGIEIHKAAIAVLFAFLAGGVVLNVLKEELPEERKSRFWAFALGAAGYTVLLLAI